MKIAMGSDHAAVELRKHLAEQLTADGHEIVDLGPDTTDSTAYAIYGSLVGQAVVAGDADLGIAICGSGVGISMAANKVPGVRAACVSEQYSAEMSRRHNDANVLCFGARVVGPDVALAICRTWLAAEYEGGRHAARVAQLASLDAGDSSFNEVGRR